jgi:hypothetical protein
MNGHYLSLGLGVAAMRDFNPADGRGRDGHY